ncbi:ras GTPase-activating-like protein IQGAP1 [Anabrus simplex]|uniref:ras GTPase-activating-like protein IQGAP1 n=1 Tax=Anabrus simplex TaxID=316456 RepID=UPI0035A3BB1D
MAQHSPDVVYESPESRQSADEMDERRQRNTAYEYLCHLEEAKKWLETVLRETLPPTTELEENLRNGVYLAKLGHLLAPDEVPLARIYDLEQKRYNVAGLQFRHTDNINYWLKSLEATALPRTFHPETTDVYDKKGMPKVIFCIHALSTHLYKLGRAPLIQDLYGKVNFTDAEIDVVQRELKKYGIQMPSFQKIGGILANDVAEDAAALHAVVIAINEIIDEGDSEEILNVLNNPDARLEHVLPYLVDRYRNILCEAKFAKSQSTMNRSSNESYVPDIYDELLTHAEIQGHITTVNVQFTWDEIVKAVHEEDYNNLATALLHGNMNLKDVNTENIAFYTEEILSVLNNRTDLEVSDYRRILQTSIHQSNKRAEYEDKAVNLGRSLNNSHIISVFMNRCLGCIHHMGCPEVITNENLWKALTSVDDCWTDHRFIRSTMTLHIHEQRRKQRKLTRRKMNTDRLKDHSTKVKFQQLLGDKLPDEYPESTEEHWATLKTAILSAGEESVGHLRVKNQDWFDENDQEIQTLIDKKRAAPQAWQINPSSLSKKREYQEVKADVQRKTCVLKNSWWTKSQERQHLAETNNTRAFFSMIKTVYGPTAQGLDTLKYRDGSTLLKVSSSINARWKEHFHELLNKDPAINIVEILKILQKPTKSHLGEVPSLQEVENAIKQLKNNRGVNYYGLSEGGRILAEHTLMLIVKIWNTETIPPDHRDALIVMIFKKGDRTDCGNYRGITLLSVAGKIPARILSNRLVPLAEDCLPETQCGFRPNRSTTDVIFCARQMQEKCKEHLPLYMAFIDLAKAFDSVKRDALWKILARIGCPQKYINILRLLQDNMKGMVLVNNNPGENFEITAGVKQGCVIAPVLFSIFAGTILHLVVSQAVKLVNTAVIEGSLQSLHSALANPVLALQFSSFALPLYLEEMKADRLDSGKDLTYSDIKASIQVLTRIADISLAVDSRNAERTWDCLYNPDAHFTDLDPAFKVKYWQALFTCRQQKLEDNCECPVLSYFDIQECVDLVNQQCEDSNQIILALQLLNAAIQAKDSSATLTAVQNPVLQLGDCISSHDSALLLRVLEDCWIRKQNDGTELWLEDVQEAVKYVLVEAEEALRVSRIISHINTALWSNAEECHLIENLQQTRPKYSSGFQELQYGKEMKSKCPWIAYRTARGNIVYLNLKTSSYSWISPKDFHSQVQLSERDLQVKVIAPVKDFYARLMREAIEIELRPSNINREDGFKLSNTWRPSILGRVDANHNKMTNKLEPLVIGLQSRCRGYLLRKTLYQRRLLKSALKIQAWWRGVKVRRELKVASKQQLKRSWSEDLLSCYKSQEQKIVKLQALWRGRLARRAFLSLFHQAQPSFKVVQQFAPLLAINPDDYNKEMQLQSLKGQVVQTIRHNKQLAHQLDTMDIKIGLLVHNRISLQDVEAHNKNLNDLAKGAALVDHTSCKGLKSLTKESRKLLEGYQNLFYMLQTNPLYLAKLMFCLPQTKSTKFLNTVILVLFNFGSNLRENYLLLRLFQTALKEEIKSKVQRPSDMITTVPHVMHLVFEYARQMVGQVSLRNMLGPLVQKILDNKTLAIDTNPIDIYKSWRNREEMMTGKSSDLPLVVNQEQALSYKEVQQKLNDGIKALKETTLMFLEHITQSRDMIPYGVLYMAKVLHNALIEKFPSAPEKDILKVVGNFIYYHFINSAIVGPDSFGIIDLPANQALTPTQRYNLASIAKILQFAASKKGFGEESRHLMCLNPFIIECHKKFKKFFRSCCEVEELESHFSIHQYSEATLISRPVIYITIEEICDTHKLLVQYLDRIVTDPLDPLCELLDEIGPAPSYETLLGSSSNDAVLLRLAKTQLCLTLVNKFEVPEDDVTDINKLFIKAKELLVYILPWLRGNSLLEGLTLPETEEGERSYADMLRSRNMLQDQNKGLNKSCSQEARSSLQESKRMLREYLCKLELAGLVSQEDGYQRIITAIAHDICNKGKYRQILMKELQTLRSTKMSLDQKTKFYEEQVALYNQYIEKCLENLTAGKRNVHSLKSSDKVPKKIKSKLVLKYTAAKLHEKGVLLEVEGLPASQFKNVQFEIAPTDHNGVFTIRGKFMGVEMEKVAVDIQDLLQLQFEGISIMDMFGKAKVNVNLLLFLLNKKYYGKV